MKNCTLIYVFGKVVGRVKNGVFEKNVRSSIHFLRKPPAIATDCAALDEAEQVGANVVAIRDQETGVVYKATIEHIREKGFILDRGYGQQIALPLEGWVRSKRGGGLPIQMGLFG